MKAKIVSFRRSLKRIKERHYVIDAGKKNKTDAEGLITKKVEWKSPAGKVIVGEISGAHGNKGCVRAIFEKGLPGQAINDNVEVLD